MAVYHLSLGVLDDVPVFSDKDLAFKTVLRETATEERNGVYMFKSEDLNEIKRVYHQVLDLFDKIYSGTRKEAKELLGEIPTTAQLLTRIAILPTAFIPPICPECGYSPESLEDNYCGQCGTKLIPLQVIEMEGGLDGN
ncbi:hypothetical protein ES707_07387 [subsurface metagenome]